MQRAKRVSEEEWELYKPEIICQYNKTSLKEMAEYMEKNHDFYATQRQYNYRLDRWGLKKYTRTKDVEVAAREFVEKSRAENLYGKCESKKQFACPFLKWKPSKFGPECSLKCFSNIGEVVCHVLESHRRPMGIVCRKCQPALSPVECLEYADNTCETPCSCKNYDPEEGMSEVQREAVFALLQSCNQNLQWATLYGLLFPMDQKIPSPHFGVAEMTQRNTAQLLNDFKRLDTHSQQELMKTLNMLVGNTTTKTETEHGCPRVYDPDNSGWPLFDSVSSPDIDMEGEFITGGFDMAVIR